MITSVASIDGGVAVKIDSAAKREVLTTKTACCRRPRTALWHVPRADVTCGIRTVIRASTLRTLNGRIVGCVVSSRRAKIVFRKLRGRWRRHANFVYR